MAFRRSIHRHITTMFCNPPYTQRYEWRIGFRHGMKNSMLHAVTKAVSRSSTIRLRCVVKRAGDAFTSAFDDGIRRFDHRIDVTDRTIGLKPIPNWPASQPASSIVLAAHNAIIFANGGALAWRQRARQYVKSVL
jgi:hypothetical protein